MKTGFCDMDILGHKFGNNLDIASDICQSGTPTLFLDVRPRKVLSGNTRQEMIDDAKARSPCSKIIPHNSCFSHRVESRPVASVSLGGLHRARGQASEL